MKGLSLWEPWASLIAMGHKTVETRSWATSYRGPLLICAAKTWDRDLAETCESYPVGDFLPLTWEPKLGHAVALADLAGCYQFTPQDYDALLAAFHAATETDDWTQRAKECALGDCRPGRYGWVLTNVRPLPSPVPVRGAQGLWDVPAEIVERLAVPA